MWVKLPLFFLLSVNIGLVLGRSPEKSDKVGLACGNMKRLEVLPGRGWDNLRNREMGQVVDIRYEECRVTPDGLYLIPDGTSAIAIKQTGLSLYSELIDHWANYSSVDTRSFSVSAEGSIFGWSIGGSYSSDYSTVKSRQVGEKSVTSRVAVTNNIYRLTTEPTAPIDPGLQNLLTQVVQQMDLNQTDTARFLLEVVVRDYGTHYLTRLDAGAILVQEDFLSRKFVANYQGDLSEIKANASVKFLNYFGASVGFSHMTNSSSSTEYDQSVTSSLVRTLGGRPLVESNSNTGTRWIDTIMDNLVAVDRFGDPLHFLVTPTNFPTIPIPKLSRLALEFKSAIDKYYSYNTRIGCMSMDSPNFDYNVNVDDKSCQSPFNNYTFGGIFQTCIGPGELCTPSSVKNPFTGDFTCLSGYESEQMRRAVNTGKKRDCWFFGIICHDVTISAVVDTFWCYAHRNNVSVNSGLMFGGTFTSKVGNLLTGSQGCPPTFLDVKILEDLHVCLGNDYELGFRYSVPFGGFFSCQFGNPLYDMILSKTRKIKRPLLSGSSNSLPNACPGGFSQHTAVVEGGDCVINYCVKANSLSNRGPVPVILPPFTKFEARFGTAGVIDNPGLGSWAIVFITIGCVGVLASVLVGGRALWKWRQRGRQEDTRRGTGNGGDVEGSRPLIRPESESENTGDGDDVIVRV